MKKYTSKHAEFKARIKKLNPTDFICPVNNNENWHEILYYRPTNQFVYLYSVSTAHFCEYKTENDEIVRVHDNRSSSVLSRPGYPEYLNH